MIAPSPLSTLFPYTTLFRSNGCQAGDEKKSGHHRHHFSNASVVCNFSSVPAVINHAHQQEEGSCGESVIHHLDDCALNSNRIECKNAENHKTKVTHGGVSNQPFHILLNHCHQCTIHNSDHSKNCHKGCKLCKRIGKDRHADSDQSVGTQFKHDSCKYNRTCGWRFCMGIR